MVIRNTNEMRRGSESSPKDVRTTTGFKNINVEW
jgi:hypothetical protein